MVAALLIGVLALAACGGGDGSDEEGVATLDDSGTDSDDSATSDDQTSDDDDRGSGGAGGRPEMSEEFEDALLEYAECMRDEGIDFPDPSTNGDGMIVIGPGGDDAPPSASEMEEFEAADEACRHIMEAVQDELPRLDPEQEAEMRDQALAFAECMREHGIDFPDPQFEDGGGVGIALEGIDPEDPDFQEAQEECSGEAGGIFSAGGRIDRRGGDEGEGE
jgi:hypothetical protein